MHECACGSARCTGVSQKVNMDTPRSEFAPGKLGLLLIALAVSASGCRKGPPAAPPPPVVQVVEVTATNAPMDTEFIGQLDSPQNVDVRARIEAFVDKMLFT